MRQSHSATAEKECSLMKAKRGEELADWILWATIPVVIIGVGLALATIGLNRLRNESAATVSQLTYQHWRPMPDLSWAKK
jgi:hypothetical protein